MKKDFLRVYSLIFCAFAVFSSIKCMFDLITNTFTFERDWDIYILIIIIAIHIGSLLLMFSGRLKDNAS